MATAEKTTKEVTKTVTVDETIIELDLSLEEATTLFTITQNIGGSDTSSRRKHMTRIQNALYNTGLVKNLLDNVVDGSIYFKNEEKIPD